MNEIYALVLGAILPPIIDLVNKNLDSSKWRFVVALLFSLVAGAVVSFFQYGEQILVDASLVFSASQAVYKLWYEKSSLREKVVKA